ncbi:MAG: class F sortase [Pseudonocardiaceae bacterium]
MTFLHRFLAALAVLIVLALLGGCSAGAGEESGDSIAAIPLPEGLDPVRDHRSVRVQELAADPTSVSIPALDIDGPLTKTGLNDDRTLEIPEFGDMSWFERGVTPGDPGPAAILGHVDTRSGPDVFYRLHELTPGDEIIVESEDGESLTFVVNRVEQHAKETFPTEAVWLPTSKPELRLITCGGDFDNRERSYRDNVIAFASLKS